MAIKWLALRSPGFKARYILLLLRCVVVPSVPPGKCWNRISNQATIASFHVISTVLFINPPSIQCYEGWNFNSGNYLFTTDTK